MSSKQPRTTFRDGLTNVLSQLVNRRQAQASNVFAISTAVAPAQLRAIYLSGIGQKIISIKAGYALNDTLQFVDDRDQEIFNNKLLPLVRTAAKFMVGFGRGVIMLWHQGDDLSKPLRWSPSETRPLKMRAFSGDMVTAGEASVDIEDERYQKPKMYQVRGNSVHWSRIIDFTYVQPPEMSAPNYNYGGVSEFELILPQLVNDAIIERSSGTIVEKNSTVFYKVKNFKAQLQAKKDKDLVAYFSKLEDARSIYGAGMVDAEDDVININQTLTNLADVDTISLRRLAMVTGIPLAWLVGENVKGLNSTGENERQIFQDMVETLQVEYLLEPVRALCRFFLHGDVSFKDNQGGTPMTRVEYDAKVIANAKVIYDMGGDPDAYLADHGVVKNDPMDELFGKDDEDDVSPEELNAPEDPTDPAMVVAAKLTGEGEGNEAPLNQ